MQSSAIRSEQVNAEKAALFAEMMRGIRERTGLSLKQVADTTRINESFLVSMEEGKLHDLPGAVFVRGFIRSLCRFYRASDAELLELFQAAVTPDGADAPSLNVPVKSTVAGVRIKGDHTQRRSWSTTSIANLGRDLMPVMPKWRDLSTTAKFAMAAIALVVVLLVLRPGSSKESHTEPVTQQEIQQKQEVAEAREVVVPPSTGIPLEVFEEDQAALPSVEVLPAKPKQVSKTSQNVKSSAQAKGHPETSASPAVPKDGYQVRPTSPNNTVRAGSGGQKLELAVREPVKVRVNFDYGQWQTKDLEPGRYQFNFDDDAQLLVFDASALDISYNGRALGALGTKGKVRRLSFAAPDVNSSRSSQRKL